MQEAQKVIDAMQEEQDTPIFLVRHYEVEFPTEAEAGEMAYDLNDGWAPFVEAEAKGKTLCFRNNKFSMLCSVAEGVEKQVKDYAKEVNESWFDGKGVMLDVFESISKYPTEWDNEVKKRYEAMGVAMKK